MGSDDYASAVGGGLKLKGSKPAGIKKKKKSKPAIPSSASAAAALSKSTSTSPPPAAAAPGEAPLPRDPAAPEPPAPAPAPDAAAKAEEERLWRQVEEQEEDYKTPTEKRHEEMRRQRLEERLKREGGAKTHKQRVEELNRYLSGLSEHHDMYVLLLLLEVWVGWDGRGGAWKGMEGMRGFANEIPAQAKNRTWITRLPRGEGDGIGRREKGRRSGMVLLGIYGWFGKCIWSYV